MTEDEAKKKWCPFARVTEKWPDGVTCARNRVVTIDGNSESELSSVEHASDLVGTKCLGSQCMAWRKEEGLNIEGYCGLAGKP